MKAFENVSMNNINSFNIEFLNISKNKKTNIESIKVLKIKLFLDLNHENLNFIKKLN